ncbi:MAG TPA: response regulator [Planctomycetota bacterium]|nr:response regulator [Planctomycetota bacterium]
MSDETQSLTPDQIAAVHRLAHEFNNQLCLIVSYSELLKDRYGQPNTERYVTSLSNAAKRSSELLTDLLALVGAGVPSGTELPLRSNGAGAPFYSAPSSAPVPPAAKKLRVLVVDDEEILVSMLAEMLTSSGHEVLTATDARKAVELYRAEFQRIDLVLLDLNMPELSGKDAFAAMKAINPQIKAVLLSGSALNHEIEALLGQGLAGYLQKPFFRKQLDDLLAKI